MVTETEHIKKTFQRNWNGPMWHGYNLQDVLRGITWQQVFVKPEKFSHNIYEQVRHMSTWRRYVLELLNGNTSYNIEMNTEADWVTQYAHTEESWQQALAEFEVLQQQLQAALENITEDMLEELVPDKKYKWYVMLHGIVHHDIYHSAQIALLKKLTAGN